ncbi:hypothetical protein QR680_004172 [Steinernema hermaphroditum]|uniref:Uncharacterized protein n=1 Tax=Steinernema hermaphroditum TaxID=289476 RepID=A0AA39HQ20_9BILA|nr:hypothetical protein QR680_004172 [Steinernema hermaphroditum]
MDGSLTADDVESILEQKIPLTYRAVNYLLHRKITDRKDICILCPGKLRGNVEVSESVVNSDLQSTRIFLCPILDSENTCILLIYDFTASPARIVTFDSLNEDLTSLRDDITEYGCRLALLLGSDRSSFENAEFITGTCAPDANENASHTWTVHNGIEATKDIGRVSDNVLLGRQNINRIRNALRSSLENDATYAALVQSVKDKKKVKQQTEKKQEPSKKQLQRYDIPKLFEEISHLLPKSDFLKQAGERK